LGFRRGAYWQAAGGDGRRATIVEVGKPVVGGGHQAGCGDDLCRDEIEMAEAEVIARIERRSTVEQKVMRRGAPDLDGGLQEVADGERTVLTEVKFVIQFVD